MVKFLSGWTYSKVQHQVNVCWVNLNSLITLEATAEIPTGGYNTWNSLSSTTSMIFTGSSRQALSCTLSCRPVNRCRWPSLTRSTLQALFTWSFSSYLARKRGTGVDSELVRDVPRSSVNFFAGSSIRGQSIL